VIKPRTQHTLRTLTLGLLVTAAVGCAGNIPNTRQGQAAGEWRFRLPTSSSPVGALAYGRGGSSAARADVQEQPQLAVAEAHKTPAHSAVRHVAPAALHEIATNPAPQPTAAPVVVSEPVQLAQAEPSADQRYGERQADAKTLDKFKGGDVIVIGAGALLLILVVVLLVLLLR
jgi:hypothetical protein